jgi:putative hydrolase of the HAD superfamily
VRSVIFDIDDTLYLEASYVQSGFRAVGTLLEQRFGLTGFEQGAATLFAEGVRGEVFDRCLERLGVLPGPELVRELVSCYRGHDPDITLLDDARLALQGAAARVPVAVVSDGPIASQRAKATRLGLATWAEPVVLTADRCPQQPKPHVRAFQLVEQALGVEGDACVYVADNPHKDFLGPRALGWRTVRVRRPGGLHADVDLPGADVEVADLRDLLTLLELDDPDEN